MANTQTSKLFVLFLYIQILYDISYYMVILYQYYYTFIDKISVDNRYNIPNVSSASVTLYNVYYTTFNKLIFPHFKINIIIINTTYSIYSVYIVNCIIVYSILYLKYTYKIVYGMGVDKQYKLL